LQFLVYSLQACRTGCPTQDISTYSVFQYLWFQICVIWSISKNNVFFVALCIFCALFIFCVVLCIFVFLCSMYCLFCDVFCIVCVYMCTEQLPPGGYPIAVSIKCSIMDGSTLTKASFAG
jgi:hypothetical protein